MSAAGFAHRPVAWRVRGRVLDTAAHTLVMGALNVTPDSFSDGGRYLEAAAAIARGREMLAQGADLIDVGGESTRPGAEPVAAAEEIRRVLPVVRALAEAGAVVSVDTSKPEVAEAALGAGAAVVNDVTALGDPDLAGLVARAGAGVVLMHMQGTPRTMQDDPRYGDVLAEVAAFLGERAAAAAAGGIDPGAVCLDPGIGFGKRLEDNLALVRRLDVFTGLDRPVLIGVSRKSFIGKILNLPPDDRLEGTIAASVLGLVHGAHLLRVHDVRSVRRAALVADAVLSLPASAPPETEERTGYVQ